MGHANSQPIDALATIAQIQGAVAYTEPRVNQVGGRIGFELKDLRVETVWAAIGSTVGNYTLPASQVHVDQPVVDDVVISLGRAGFIN